MGNRFNDFKTVPSVFADVVVIEARQSSQCSRFEGKLLRARRPERGWLWVNAQLYFFGQTFSRCLAAPESSKGPGNGFCLFRFWPK